MVDFLDKEWNDFQKRLEQTAQHLAGENQDLRQQFAGETADFIESDVPESYPDLLEKIKLGTQLAIGWQQQSGNGRVDQTQMPYAESDSHEPMPQPTDSISEQAERADLQD